MTYFHAPAAVLTPDDNGDLTDVTGFVRAWTLADGTALVEADSVTGGTVLRTDDELDDAETPTAELRDEVRTLDALLANVTEGMRHIKGAFSDADGNLTAEGQTLCDQFCVWRDDVTAKRDAKADAAVWPADSVRGVLLAAGENPDRIGAA